MVKEIQSPSSILTYKQCPRKYYYQYNLHLPTKPSIHLVRGNIVHEVLEHFFTIDLNSVDEKDFEFGFRSYLSAHLLKAWKNSSAKLIKLGLTSQQLEFYLLESLKMLNIFVENFAKKLRKEMHKRDFKAAFKALTPSVEEEIVNSELKIS
jgi:ATP-dependent helicase/DNAse subunit B